MPTDKPMQLRMVGLGRMGAGIVRRLTRDGHRCVGYDINANAVQAIESDGIVGARKLQEFAAKLDKPRAAWVMVPAGETTSKTIQSVAEVLEPGDVIIDGGNTHYHDDIRHAAELREQAIHHVDVGTSGGVYGLERGFCLMIGGERRHRGAAVPAVRLDRPRGRRRGTHARSLPDAQPIRVGLPALRSERRRALREDGPQRDRVRDDGRVRGGAQHPHGRQRRHPQEGDGDAETAPLEHPEYYQYDFDTTEIAEVWRRGSVIGSWLLDLTAEALLRSPSLEEFSGRVSDSGEGRWTSTAAIEEGVPTPVLSSALYSRFSSRGLDDFADRALSAMRKQFGGHAEKAGG